MVYSSTVGIGTHSSLGDSLALCFFISSGKNAASVQKQPKTFYEWDPLNFNISEFPKAVNRISCIVEEVLNTYIQAHGLFISGSCSSEHTIRPSILLPLGCVLASRKCCQVGRGWGLKIVPFDIVGLFIGMHPVSLRGAPAAVMLCRKNEVPIYLGMMVLRWIQLKVICYS